jgi:murein DD-endopeptidase MepM/ murein hydrolase activator NlpD
MVKKRLKLIILATTISLIVPFNFAKINSVSAQVSSTSSISEDVFNLDKQMREKEQEIKDLQKKSDSYKQQIEAAQKKSATLENEVAILSNQIAKINIDIDATEKQIEEIGLEITNLGNKIQTKEEEITKNKGQIAEMIRMIYENDQKNYLEVLAENQSFSQVFDQMQYVENLQGDLQKTLDQVQKLKSELENQKTEQENKKTEQEKSKNDLTNMQASLEEQMSSKELLLSETSNSEKQFQNWLLESKYEEDQLNTEITNLDKTIRQKLEESDKSFSTDSANPGAVALSWPVDHSRGLSATFHDPDYPFRYLFEHPAVDIRAYQGTPVGAAAPGYVAKVQNGGKTGYSYIMIIHANGVSTVYGHISKLMVQEDTYVIRGQIIGLSGGMPGTPGAGPYTTGPHLHFEVRLNGIPVNPLDYLI